MFLLLLQLGPKNKLQQPADRLLEAGKKEHSRHLVVWLYLKPQMALVFSYNHSTAGVLFFQYETNRGFLRAPGSIMFERLCLSK